MQSWNWIFANWSELLQNVGIIAGLIFTAHSIRRDSSARKIGNLIALSERHHAIWKQIYDRPELARILDETPPLKTKPVTFEEHRFVTSIVVHLYAVHWAIKAKMFVKPEGLHKDIKSLFRLPIPFEVWGRLRPFQDEDFVRFVESTLKS
jgi:hypothetical protein